MTAGSVYHFGPDAPAGCLAKVYEKRARSRPPCSRQ